MEVIIPTTRSPDFDFNSARSSPCSTAPTTPRRFGEFYSYFSAPTSPSRMSEFYNDFEEFTSEMKSSNMAAVPFMWEEKPGTPKGGAKAEDEFAFDFCADAEKASRSAEELFDGGRIKPLKPPPRLQFIEDDDRGPLLSPKSPRSPRTIINRVFSPRQRKERKDCDLFKTAAENTRKQAVNERGRGRHSPRKQAVNERGRGRSAAMDSSSSRRGTRSLSPYRVSAYPWEEEEKQQQQDNTKQSSVNLKDSISSTNSKSSRRWRLRDLLLFRSASEGHATSKDHVKKYSLFFRKHEDVKNASFRSNESSGSVKGSRRKVPISAHELYYNANRAAQDSKKKTSLPYKQGIWGRLAF